MRYQNEEEAAILDKEVVEVVNDAASFKKSILVITTLCILAILGTIGFYQIPQSRSISPMMSMKLIGKEGVKLSKKEKAAMDQKAYEKFAKQHASETTGVIKNKYMAHLAVSDSFAPYAYLKNKFLTLKYKTVGHGIDEEGYPDDSKKAFYNVDVSFFNGVYKTHYNRIDRSVVESKTLVGQFKGLDEEGNMIFIDGAYCEAEQGPSYGKLEVLCGNNFKIIEVQQVSQCELLVKVTHPNQCQNPVKTVTPTDH